MAALTIASALSPIVDAYGVGREIVQTTVNAMDAAEKERDSGADKKAWVFNGELFCQGWYKKGETIYKKWCDTKLG